MQKNTQKKKVSLSTQMIIALLAGIITGAVCNHFQISTAGIKPFGDAFISLVKCWWCLC